jgi:diaminopimelate epimerase
VPIHLAHIHPKGAAVYAGIAPVAVNVGNPHIVFFITNMEALDIHTLGPLIENDPLFPDRVNVSFAEILNRQFIRAQVWERGTGSTLACGSAACAMAVAGHTLGLTERQVTIEQPGGQLSIKWLDNSHVDMTGPTTITFEGMTSNGLVATT